MWLSGVIEDRRFHHAERRGFAQNDLLKALHRLGRKKLLARFYADARRYVLDQKELPIYLQRVRHVLLNQRSLFLSRHLPPPLGGCPPVSFRLLIISRACQVGIVFLSSMDSVTSSHTKLVNNIAIAPAANR